MENIVFPRYCHTKSKYYITTKIIPHKTVKFPPSAETNPRKISKNLHPQKESLQKLSS